MGVGGALLASYLDLLVLYCIILLMNCVFIFFYFHCRSLESVESRAHKERGHATPTVMVLTAK